MIELISIDGTATDIVSLQSMKDHLRIDGTSDDSYITALISSAVEFIEEATARDFIEKTWKEVLPCFPSDYTKIELLKPPLKTVTSIDYYDVDGVDSYLDEASYIVRKPHQMPGYVVLAPNYLWPSLQSDRDDAVRITFTTSSTVIPETLKQCVKLLVGLWFENRENLEDGKPNSTAGIDRLIAQLSHGGYY